MADNRKSYHAVIRAFEQKHGLNRAQARVVWRSLRDRLDKTPRLADLKKHPRITAQEVQKGPARERAQRAAKTRARHKAEKAEEPKMVIPPARFRQIEQDWADFDAVGWQDDPDESS